MDKESPLLLWLQSLNLTQYYDNFHRHGILTKSQCQHLNEKTLTELGITVPGHHTRILTHLPTGAGDKYWPSLENDSVSFLNPLHVNSMSQPELPPKKNPARCSYLYQDIVLPDLTQNANTPATRGYISPVSPEMKPVSPASSPRPVPRPRSSKPKTPTSDMTTLLPSSDVRPIAAERPTPAPRASRVPRDKLNFSVKLDDACTSESTTEHVSSYSPEALQAKHREEDLSILTTQDDSTCLYVNIPPCDSKQTNESESLKSESPNNFTGTLGGNLESPLEHVVTVKEPAHMEPTYQNVEYGLETQTYSAKPEPEKIDNSFDHLLYADADKSDTAEISTPRLPTACESHTDSPVGENTAGIDDEAYGAVWVDKRSNPVSSTSNRSSCLMQFPSLTQTSEFKYSNGKEGLNHSLEFDQRDSGSFNLPPPVFAPPPLPNNTTEVPSNAPSNILEDFDPFSQHPMPSLPPRRPSDPFESLPVAASGGSQPLPQAVYEEEPIYEVAEDPVDPFQNVDPFSDFVPDYQEFDPGANSFTSPFKSPKTINQPQKFKDWTVMFDDSTTGDYSKASDPGSQVITSGLKDDTECVYEVVNDQGDFDPFGLKSANEASGGEWARSASTGSGSSHQLDSVPPPPAWHETVHDLERMYSYAHSQDGDSCSSNGSIDALIDVGSVDESSSGGGMTQVEILPVSAMSPKRRERSGYLFKQGGVKQNRGWQKRWVIFDGNSLRYYADAKTQVSKRIVPLSCMKDVDIDVKPSTSKQYKFRLQCTNRTFLFATDSLDDCTMWSQTLMEAITVYTSVPREEVPGGDMANPDMASWIRWNRNRFKYYVALKGSKLCYYQSLDDFKMASPLHEFEMKLSTIRELERTKLRLCIHYSNKPFILHFDSSSDASNWKMAIEEAITNALGDNDVLDQMKENPANTRCADCGCKEAHWASMNLGIILCVKCAGIHRGFDQTLSKVRSLRMDTKIWNSSLIEMFKVIGNENANKFWCAKLPPESAINEHSETGARKRFIHEKYKEKIYADLHEFVGDKQKLNKALLDAAQTDNIYLTLQLVMSGADVLYFKPGEPNTTAYELATEAKQRIQTEFLLQNGGDKTRNFMPGSEEESLVAKRRAQVQLQGILEKTGPNLKGLNFEKRLCILEHGRFSYFDEDNKSELGRIENDSIMCLQARSFDKYPWCIEISTKKRNNRVFLFSAASSEERLKWMQAIAQIFCPVVLMEDVCEKDVSLTGYAYLKLGITGEWQRTFVMLENRSLYFMDKGQQECQTDSIDLRRVTNISKLSSESNPDCEACLERGPQIFLHTTDRTLYFQADLARDTDRMFNILEMAVKRGGDTLEDQVLNNEGIPIIVDCCVNFIETHGITMKGVYREAAQKSKVQALLDRFAADARSVVLKLGDHSVNDVCNCLKRFLRYLADPLLTSQLYSRWIQTADISGDSYHATKLGWYKYLLEQLPRVHYLTLRHISTHLCKLSKYSERNLMTIDNISRAFGSTFMVSEKASNGTPTSNDVGIGMQLEMKTISDIITYYEWLFDVKQNESIAESIDDKRKKLLDLLDKPELTEPSKGLMIFIYHLAPTGTAHSVMVTEDTTVSEVIAMVASKMNESTTNLALYEIVRNDLERPLPGGAAVQPLVFDWQKWKQEYTSNACLCLKSRDLLDKIERSYNPGKPLFATEVKYADRKKFTKMAFEFTQSKISCYKDTKNVTTPAGSWKIEDLNLYLGFDSRRSSHPTKFAITFYKKGENDMPYFGRTVCFPTEAELYTWYSCMWITQNPQGFSDVYSMHMDS